MAEDDWTVGRPHPGGWQERPGVVGDGSFVTNTACLAQGIKQGVANAILIKVNQIGSLTETFDAVRTTAHRNAYRAVMSHCPARPRTTRLRTSRWRPIAARRSERASEPVLIWPQLVATARSAIVLSSVSPERWDITAR